LTKRIHSKVPAATIFFSALLLSACGGSEEASDDSAASTSSEASSEINQSLEETVETAANNVADAADSATDKMANVTQQAADSAGEAMDDAKAAAENAIADGQAKVEEAVANASDAMEATAAAVQGGDGASEYASLTGDATNGRRVFAKCMACHRVQEGVNLVGPSLYGIVGRDAGTIEGFNYSDANANSGITWTEDVMFEYLKAPQEYIPGTRMIFPGLPSAQDRADVIAYLKAESE